MYMLVNRYNDLVKQNNDFKQSIPKLDKSLVIMPHSYQRSQVNYQNLNDMNNEISPNENLHEGGSSDDNDESPCVNQIRTANKEKSINLHKQKKLSKHKTHDKYKSKKKKSKHDKI